MLFRDEVIVFRNVEKHVEVRAVGDIREFERVVEVALQLLSALIDELGLQGIEHLVGRKRRVEALEKLLRLRRR